MAIYFAMETSPAFRKYYDANSMTCECFAFAEGYYDWKLRVLKALGVSEFPRLSLL